MRMSERSCHSDPGIGARLQISSVGTKLDPSKYEAFVVGLGKRPLIAEYDGAQHCIEVKLSP